MDDDPVRFAADLYHGTAGYYDRYRLPYPEAMLADLVQCAQVPARGRLLDLACGTGQLAFPLRQWFSEAWAVDQEPGMIDVVRAKAEALGAAGIRLVTAAVEALDAEAGYFDLAVIGNAFHRLDRDQAAARLYGWLRPGGCAALCWSSGPEAGEQPWQRAMAEVTGRWRTSLGAGDRVPADWNERRTRRPDRQVLSDAGFAVSGRREFSAVRRWSIAGLAGYTRSTSVLPPSVLADQGAAFDADLAAALGPPGEDGTFTQAVSFAYELARKPA